MRLNFIASRSRNILANAFTILCMSAASVLAAGSDDELFEALVTSKQHQMFVGVKLADDETILTPSCADFVPVGLQEVHALSPVSFAAAGEHPTAGAWMEIWNMNVCGTVKRRSILFAVIEGRLQSKAYAPGETKADVRLFNDAQRQADLAARYDLRAQIGKECNEQLVLTDTYLKMELTPYGPPPPELPRSAGDIDSVWKEEWHYRGCGYESVLEVDFIVMKTGGTTYSIKAKTPGN